MSNFADIVRDPFNTGSWDPDVYLRVSHQGLTSASFSRIYRPDGFMTAGILAAPADRNRKWLSIYASGTSESMSIVPGQNLSYDRMRVGNGFSSGDVWNNYLTTYINFTGDIYVIWHGNAAASASYLNVFQWY